MRRWSGIIALLLFTVTLVGVYPTQWALRTMARRDMSSFIRARGVRDAGVIHISFRSKNGEIVDPQFQWEEKDKEFELNGRMYDIVERSVKGDLITFHCIEDGRETDLVSMAKRLGAINGMAGPARGKSGPLLKFITERYLCEDHGPKRVDPLLERNLRAFNSVFVSSGFVGHHTPPPRA